MTHSDQVTTTQLLRRYKELKSERLSPSEIARKLGREQSTISNFKAYCKAVCDGRLGCDLPHVIEIHSNQSNPNKSDRFHFFDVYDLLGINLRKMEPVAYSAYEQDIALEATLEEAQDRGAVSRDAEVVSDLADNDILELSFSVFKNALKR